MYPIPKLHEFESGKLVKKLLVKFLCNRLSDPRIRNKINIDLSKPPNNLYFTFLPSVSLCSAKGRVKSCIDSAGNSAINLFLQVCVAGHSATLVRARSMLRTVNSVPDLTISMSRTVTLTRSCTNSAGNSAINLFLQVFV